MYTLKNSFFKFGDRMKDMILKKNNVMSNCRSLIGNWFYYVVRFFAYFFFYYFMRGTIKYEMRRTVA